MLFLLSSGFSASFGISHVFPFLITPSIRSCSHNKAILLADMPHFSDISNVVKYSISRLLMFFTIIFIYLNNCKSILQTYVLLQLSYKKYLSSLIHLPQPLLLRSNPQYLLQIPSHSLDICIHLFYCSCPVTSLTFPLNYLFAIIFLGFHIHISIHQI